MVSGVASGQLPVGVGEAQEPPNIPQSSHHSIEFVRAAVSSEFCCSVAQLFLIHVSRDCMPGSRQSLSSRVYSNSCPLSRCHPTISSSATPFSYPQSFPASGYLLMSQLFASSGRSIRASASASVLMNA